MEIFKELGKKNWIDWKKIIVAIDIASAGIGLIMNIDMHVFGYLLRIINLGFLSRMFIGVMYVFVAVLIFKRIFPQKLAKEEHVEAEKMNKDIEATTTTLGGEAKRLFKKVAKATDSFHTELDNLLDKGEEFIGKRKKEADNEVKRMMNSETTTQKKEVKKNNE